MADRASTKRLPVDVTFSLPRVWSDLERRLTVNLSENSIVGQHLGGGSAG